MPVKTKEAKTIETVTIRAIKNFYINGAIAKVNDIVKDVWIVEAKGYVATKKAIIIDPVPAPPVPAKPAPIVDTAKTKVPADDAPGKKKEGK